MEKNKKILYLIFLVIIIALFFMLIISLKNETVDKIYRITFDNGQFYFTDIEPDGKVKEPIIQLKDNLKFIGWYNNNTLFNFDKLCHEDIYLTAYYLSEDGNIVDGYGNVNNKIAIPNTFYEEDKEKTNEEKYTIKFYYDDTKIEPFIVYQVHRGDKIDYVTVSEEENRDFKGWYVNDKLFNFNSEITNNITLYGKWEQLKYTVKFDSAGGNKISSQEIDYNNVPKNIIPTRNGYIFNGWLYKGNIYNFDYSFNKNVTLTASWIKTEQKSEYNTVKFIYNSSSINDNTIKVKPGTNVNEPVNPQRDGYTFEGWYLNQEQYNFNNKIESNISLYAKWKKIIYTLKFNNQGAKTETKDIKISYGESFPMVTPPKRSYTISLDYNSGGTNISSVKATYTFNGYYTNINGNGQKIYNSDGTSKKQYDSYSDTTLFAYWTDGNITLPTPSRDGYKFNGWYTSSTGGNKITSTTKYNKDMTIYAQWSLNENPTIPVINNNEKYYTVSFHSNGGTNISSIKVQEGSKIDSLPTPTKTHYIFDGWYTKNKIKYTTSTKINSDISLYANWIPTIKYSYNTNGKFFFINNPELLMDKFTTDVSGKALYRDEFSGNAEFYYEHIIHYGYSYYYAIKIYNPNQNPTTLSFSNCASDSSNKTDNPVTELLTQYYNECKINKSAITLSSNETAYIYINPNSSNYKYYVDKSTTKVPTSVTKVTGNIEGFIKMNSSDNLIFAVILFNDINKSANTTYDGNLTDVTTDNYGGKHANSQVFSGKLNTLNVTSLNFTYDIYDITPTGNLLVNYKDAANNNKTLDYWKTNIRGNVNTTAIGSDYAPLIVPVTNKSTITINPYPIGKEERNVYSINKTLLKGNPYNWANWAIHYDEKIKIYNHTNSTKVITYRISYSNCPDITTNRLGILYNDNIYTLGHNNNYKDFTVTIGANKSVTINPISTLTGFSCEYVTKKLILN